MRDKAIALLEEKIERLVEGAFTQLFRKSVSAHEVAIQLVRCVENGLHEASGEDQRPIIPDRYVISMHPRVHEHLQSNQPDLPVVLGQYLVDFAAQAGYRLAGEPELKLRADPDLSPTDIDVRAYQENTKAQSTGIMQRIHPDTAANTPRGAQLIINGNHTVPLTQGVTNIGRSDDNEIIIEDPYISRHHLQIRFRFGAYTLFDVQSRGGTRVNNILVREHILQDGDVIQIGKTQIVFVSDDGRSSLTTTDTLVPVDL